MNAAPWRAALERALERTPPATHAARRGSLERFLELGFPAKKLEDWRYTDLAPLAAREHALAGPAAAPDLSAWQLPDTDRQVFVNGVRDDGLSTAPRGHAPAGAPRPGASDALAHLNAALSAAGATLRLEPGATLRPVHVLCVAAAGTPGTMSHLAHDVELGAGARATLIFQELALGDAPHFLTQRARLRLGDGAHLQVIRMQEHGAAVQAVARWEAVLGRDAVLDWSNVDLGGGLVRNDLVADLSAPGARVELRGLFAPGGATHVDNHTRIDHRAPHTASRESYRGVVRDRAHAVFNGKIVVHEGAAGTDSEQRVASLLLSPHAEVNAKPELEIYNDNVKCAHGATCGQLDPAAVHYLRSRGIPEAAARNLLVYAFAYDVLRAIPHETARGLAARRLLARLPGAPDPRELQ